MRRMRLLILASACAALLTVAPAALGDAVYTPVSGSPFGGPLAENAWTIAFSPSGTLVAVPNVFSSSITILRVDPTTGSMTAITPPTSTLTVPLAVAFATAGTTTYLAVAGEFGANRIALYSVAGDGTLTLIKAVPFAGLPVGLAFNSAGTLLAIATLNGTLQTYQVSSTDLTPAPGGTAALGGQGGGIAFNHSGTLLAVTQFNNALVNVYAVTGTGALSLVGSPTATGTSPAAAAFSPTDPLLAVANKNDSTVSIYTVSPTGVLTAAGTPTATGSDPLAVAFSPTGRLLATANRLGSSLSLFTVNGQTGALAEAAGSPLYTGTGTRPQAAAFGPAGLLAAPDFVTGAVHVFAPAPPTATITYPPPGGRTYALGSTVRTSFTCADSQFGPGVASCTDSAGAASPGGRLPTSSAGPQTYIVTARSQDGQTGQARIAYRVAGSPVVTISSPRSGRTYRLGQRVSTIFGCVEGAGGPGIVACGDSGGATHFHGRLDTTRLGRHAYTVTGISADGLQTATRLSFSVARASPGHRRRRR